MANGMTTDVYHRDNCIAPKRNQQTSRSVFSKNARLMWWLLALAAAHPSPHQLIIDTDMGRLGVDDVGAVCVALALVRLGGRGAAARAGPLGRQPEGSQHALCVA